MRQLESRDLLGFWSCRLPDQLSIVEYKLLQRVCGRRAGLPGTKPEPGGSQQGLDVDSVLKKHVWAEALTHPFLRHDHRPDAAIATISLRSHRKTAMPPIPCPVGAHED